MEMKGEMVDLKSRVGDVVDLLRQLNQRYEAGGTPSSLTEGAGAQGAKTTITCDWGGSSTRWEMRLKFNVELVGRLRRSYFR